MPPRDDRPRRSQSAFTAAALAFIAALGLWWLILLARLSEENHALALQVHPEEPELRDHLDRRRWMIVGEGSTAMLLIVLLAGVSVKRGRDEARQAARLEGLLVASTHELKTPITALRALLESFASGAIPAGAEATFARRGVDACDRLTHLVEGILAVQKQVAASDPTHETAPLRSFVEDTLRLRGEPVGDVDLGDAADAPVHVVRDGFRVILDNLLDNARKYSERPARLRARRDAEWVWLAVIDDGPGFASGEAERLFEPYTRGEAGRQQIGTGLGLYLARTLATGMGAELTAHSDGPGSGATFALRIPTAR